jgi:predicted nucleic acid-binding protein
MSMYYLDSSAWMKRYLFETGSPFVTRVFDNGEHLACSMLGIVEVNATLARR